LIYFNGKFKNTEENEDKDVIVNDEEELNE